MVDVDAEIEKSLLKGDYDGAEIVYQYPKTFTKLPVISYYNLTEHPDFSADNAELIQSGWAQVDIWADKPNDCGKIAVKINEVMNADGWAREFSMSLKPDENGAYHKTMRFAKIFNL